MNKLLILFFFLLCVPTFAQEMELYDEFIASKKRYYCQAYASVATGTQAAAPFLSTEWEFDKKGRQIAYRKYDEKGGMQVKMWWVFDATGRPIASEKDNFRINEHERIAYNYDEKGRLIEEIEYRDRELVVSYKHFYGDDLQKDSTHWIDNKGDITLREFFTYDENGRLIKQQEVNLTGKAEGRTEYEYHEDGTLKYEVLYDSFGDAFEKIVYNESGFPTKREITYIDYTVSHEFEYDKKGFLIKMVKKRTDQPGIETITFKWMKAKPTIKE